MLKNISEILRQAAQVLSYDYMKDPLIVNLKKVTTALEQGNWEEAKRFLTAYQVKVTIDNRIKQYATLDKFKDLEANYKKAIDLIGTKSMDALTAVNAIIDAHKNAKAEIEKLQGVRR